MIPSTHQTAGAFIPWHRRLEARVLTAVMVIAGVSLTAVLLATSRVVQDYSLTRSADDLRAGRAAFNRLVETRARSAASMTRLVAELPLFRAHLTETDAATIGEMADDYRGKLAADFNIVTDPRGNWLGKPGWPPGAAPAPSVAATIDTARQGRSAREIVSLPDGMYLVVSEPAMFAEEVLGTMTAGYRLDDRVAEELSLIAHCDVNLVCSDGRLCGSSLEAPVRTDLATLLERDRARLGAIDEAPQLRTIGSASYVSAVYPLLPDSGRRDAGQLVLLQPWQPTQRALDQIEWSLILVSVATFSTALGSSLLLSRRLTRPLRNLAEVANDIAAGHWTGRVPVDGPVEARLMATAFNDMTATLSHWHSEATHRSEQLQDSYDRFRSVTESANDAIVSVDGDGRIVFWNRRAESVFGYSEQEALEHTLTMLIPERYLQSGADAIRASLAGGEAEWIGRTVEVSGRRRDGGETPLELSLSTWKAGPAVFYTGIIRDITDRKQAAEALRLREEQLRQSQKMEAIGRLAGGIAHDFNNLLTAILGYSDFLMMDVPPALRGDVEGVQKAGRSAAVLTRQLLAFSRQQVLQPVVLDINTVVIATDKLLRRLISENVELVMALEPDLPRITADPGQIEQVILNLAVNARDAMPEGGQLTIATSTEEVDAAATPAGGMTVTGGRYVVLSVRDTGSGMTADVRARIFEPFFTTKEVGKGTGLGLATVYGIVQQSGGSIHVDSAPGMGTTFRIALPAMLDAPSASQAVTPASASPPRGSETVLLVEDNASVRALAAKALQRSGYRVLEAENGEQGVQLAREHRMDIDITITDVVMPVMGGREMAARLLSIRPDMKIIFTSGYTDDDVIRRDALQPGSPFIQKPFTAEALTRLVRDVLDGRTNGRQAERDA